MQSAKLEDHRSRQKAKTNASVLYKDALKSGEESLNEPMDGNVSCIYSTEYLYKYSIHSLMLLFHMEKLPWLNCM